MGARNLALASKPSSHNTAHGCSSGGLRALLLTLNKGSRPNQGGAEPKPIECEVLLLEFIEALAMYSAVHLLCPEAPLTYF